MLLLYISILNWAKYVIIFPGTLGIFNINMSGTCEGKFLIIKLINYIYKILFLIYNWTSDEKL